MAMASKIAVKPVGSTRALVRSVGNLTRLLVEATKHEPILGSFLDQRTDEARVV